MLFYLPHRVEKKEELAFVSYFEIIPPAEKIDGALNCICLYWATADVTDYSLSRPVTAVTQTVKWYGFIQFASIVPLHHVVRGNTVLRPFIDALSGPCHRLYVNRFYDYT